MSRFTCVEMLSSDLLAEDADLLVWAWGACGACGTGLGGAGQLERTLSERATEVDTQRKAAEAAIARQHLLAQEHRAGVEVRL